MIQLSMIQLSPKFLGLAREMGRMKYSHICVLDTTGENWKSESRLACRTMSENLLDSPKASFFPPSFWQPCNKAWKLVPLDAWPKPQGFAAHSEGNPQQKHFLCPWRKWYNDKAGDFSQFYSDHYHSIQNPSLLYHPPHALRECLALKSPPLCSPAEQPPLDSHLSRAAVFLSFF